LAPPFLKVEKKCKECKECVEKKIEMKRSEKKKGIKRDQGYKTRMLSSMQISSTMLSAHTRVSTEIAKEVIEACASQYGFDAEDAKTRLGLYTLKITMKKNKSKLPSKSKVEKPSIPLPFDGTCAPGMCSGLKQNHGLYTQCQGSQVEDSEYCKGCMSQCGKNESGKPTNGTIQDRMSADFKGPKGDAPKHYTAVMKKLKLTKEQVLEEAAKFNLVVDEENFIAPVQTTKRGRPKKAVTDAESSVSTSKEPKKRGRPKKQEKDVKPDAVEDLFANLVSSAEVDDAESETSSLSGSENDSEVQKSSTKEAEKAEKKAAKEAAKAAKEAAKEAEKIAKEAEKANAKAAKEAEKAEKKAIADAEKAAKEAEKEALKAEKAAKKEADAQEKAAKKAKLEAEKAEKSKSKAKSESAAADVSEQTAVLKVKKFEYKGVKYLKSANGVVYNMEQDEVGTWNEESKEIVFKEADEEEEEEEYESENE